MATTTSATGTTTYTTTITRPPTTETPYGTSATIPTTMTTTRPYTYPTETTTSTYTTTPTTTYTTTPTTTYTTTPTTTTQYVPTICPYGTPIKVVFEKVFANNDYPSKPVVVEISSNGKEGLPKNMELFKAEDEDSMYLEPHQIERKYSNALNTFLSKLLPRTRSQTAYAVIFKTKKSESDIKYMFTQRHIVGRVWRIVFPEQDSYIYNNDDGTRNVVTVLRRVQNGRRYLGIDFWYSHYYLVGYYGIPDFYKLVKFP